MPSEAPGILDDRIVKETIEWLDDLQDKRPEELIAKLREAELKLVDLRDSLIDVPRDRRPPRLLHELEQINIALSLTLAVEYPVSSLERRKIKDAADVLKSLQK